MKLSAQKLTLVGLLALSLAEGLTHFGQAYPDSPGYIDGAHFFQGKATIAPSSTNFRLLRPVIPFIASVLNHFLDIRTSFAIVNLVLWCAAAILMFYFTKMITKDLNAALFSSTAFTTAIPLLIFGDAVLTDMAGYFFILFGTFLAIKWDLPRASLRRVCIAGLIIALGVLCRESVASVLIFVLAWTVLSKGSISRIIILFSVSIGIPILASLVVGVSYIAWYTQGGLLFAAANQQLGPVDRALRLAGSFLYAFGRYPQIILLAGLGLLATKDKAYLKIHISIWIGALAILLAWPVVDTRFTFMLFPSILPLAGEGVRGAYDIVMKSRLFSGLWPSFRESKRSRFMFLLLVVGVCALITNIVTRHFVSFPWSPYTDPLVKITDIQ